MSSGYISGLGACEWLFYCGCLFLFIYLFFVFLEFVSLLLPPCTWAGMVGWWALSLVRLAAVAFFCKGLWFWYRLCGGTYMFVPCLASLKGIHHVLGGEIILNVK